MARQRGIRSGEEKEVESLRKREPSPMLHRTRLVDIELSRPPEAVEGLDGYVTLKALIRLHGSPIGSIEIPVDDGRCSAAVIRRAILERYNRPIIRRLLIDLLASPPNSDGWQVADLFRAPHPERQESPTTVESLPTVTVAVCTRNHTTDLAICLESLNRLEYADLDLLVVDNAPEDDSTERLVRNDFPNVRYVCEPRPGLDWARNRAIVEARGEIIAYTDDDAVVDPGWVRALVGVFAENREVMAVTGLVVPHEIETEAQFLFELYGGFGRGFERKWYRYQRRRSRRWTNLGTGQFGTGANMAFRHSVFDRIGFFDPALDVGTVTNGGGDLEMFFRVLKCGHTLVYEPDAIVRHRHRREYDRLRKQIRNNGVGLLSFWVRTAMVYPDEIPTVLKIASWWLGHWNIRRLLLSLLFPARFPRDLILAEWKGFFVGWTRYRKARHTAARIVDVYGSIAQADWPIRRSQRTKIRKRKDRVSVHSVDLAQPIRAIEDGTDSTTVRIFVSWKGRVLGEVDIPNDRQVISPTRLREAIVNGLGLKVIEADRTLFEGAIRAETLAVMMRHYMPKENRDDSPPATGLPDNVSVSVVVGTLDRPEDLHECLQCLVAQESPRRTEIIIVDNNPSSGLTAPVVAEFPGVLLLNEPRRGLSYARNAGFAASTGDIVITTDDDVVQPPDWLEKLVSPFSRPAVMVVTGNVLPLELATTAQRQFEKYGGLGRGFKPLDADGDWFESFRYSAVPTWELGGTANAAFRAEIFCHPRIGLMEETLGPGVASSVGEDTYLFYKVLKAGYCITYEPAALVWHKHRRDMRSLTRQIFGYSKGHVAYHLTTLFCDHDLRSLLHLGYQMPKWRLRQFLRRIKDRRQGKGSTYPLWLILLEIAGNLIGPWALWRSYRYVRREGRSQPYIPVAQRSPSGQARSSHRAPE